MHCKSDIFRQKHYRTYPCPFRARSSQRCTLALLSCRRRLLRHRLFAQRTHVEISILAPTDATIVAQHVGRQTLRRLPPRLRLACTARTAAVAATRDLGNDGALVVRHGRDRGGGHLLARRPRRFDTRILFAELRAVNTLSVTTVRRSELDLPLPVTVEPNHLWHGASADFLAHWSELCAVHGNGVFEGGNLSLRPLLVGIPSLGLLPLQTELWIYSEASRIHVPFRVAWVTSY